MSLNEETKTATWPDAGRVMIVDDEPALLSLLGSVLENAGFAVHTSDSAGRTLQALVDFQPTVILTDLLMPKMNGFQFLQAVRRSLKDLPIILMSGAARVESEGMAEVLNVFTMLEKPFKMDSLIESCRRATEKLRLEKVLRESSGQLIRHLSDLTECHAAKDLMGMQKSIARDMQAQIEMRERLRKLQNSSNIK